MARMRVFLVLVLAIGAGGAFAVATYNYVQKLPSQSGASMPTRPVVVATVDLEVGADITKDDVKVIQWPASSVPQGAFTNANEVIGRGLIMPMIQNEPFLPLKLASKEAGAG